MLNSLPVSVRPVTFPPQTAEDYVVNLLTEFGDAYAVPAMAAASAAAFPDADDELVRLACLRAKLQGVVPQILRDGPAGCSPLDARGLLWLDWHDVTARTLAHCGRVAAPWDAPGDGDRGRDRDGGDVLAVACVAGDDLLMRDRPDERDPHFVTAFVG